MTWITLPQSRTHCNFILLLTTSLLVYLFDKSENLSISQSIIQIYQKLDPSMMRWLQLMLELYVRSISKLFRLFLTTTPSGLSHLQMTHQHTLASPISIIGSVFISMEFCTIFMQLQFPCLIDILVRICSTSSLHFLMLFVWTGEQNSLV